MWIDVEFRVGLNWSASVSLLSWWLNEPLEVYLLPLLEYWSICAKYSSIFNNIDESLKSMGWIESFLPINHKSYTLKKEKKKVVPLKYSIKC